MRNDKRGRPPIPEGERVQDFPKISLPMRPPVRALLDAFVQVFNRTAYRVVEDALLRLRESQPPNIRTHIDTLLKESGSGVPELDSVPVNIPKRYRAAVDAFLQVLEHPRSSLEGHTRDYFLKVLRVELDEAKKEGNGHE